MTRDQFINLMVKAAGPTRGIMQRFIQDKTDLIYDPALEDNDLLQLEQAIKEFAIAAECLDDLVAELADAANEIKTAKRNGTR